MGFYRAYPMDEDSPDSEYVTERRVRNGIDTKTKARGWVVIPAFLEKCCGVDLVPGLSE
jgi:hypothetical protein